MNYRISFGYIDEYLNDNKKKEELTCFQYITSFFISKSKKDNHNMIPDYDIKPKPKPKPINYKQYRYK
jgi:hypothetical protein